MFFGSFAQLGKKVKFGNKESHSVFRGDLVYKLRRVKCEANDVSSDSQIVKRLRRRKYDQVIIERTIGLVFGPSTACTDLSLSLAV